MGTEANRTDSKPVEEISGALSPCCLFLNQSICHPDNHTTTQPEKSMYRQKDSPDSIDLYKIHKIWLSVTQRAGTFLGTSEITQ